MFVSKLYECIFQSHTIIESVRGQSTAALLMIRPKFTDGWHVSPSQPPHLIICQQIVALVQVQLGKEYNRKYRCETCFVSSLSLPHHLNCCRLLRVLQTGVKDLHLRLLFLGVAYALYKFVVRVTELVDLCSHVHAKVMQTNQNQNIIYMLLQIEQIFQT